MISFLMFVTPVYAEEATPPLGERVNQEVKEIHELAGRGKMDEAIQKLQTLLQELPESAPIRLQYDLANLLFLQGRYREARAAYQKVLILSEEENEFVSRSKERIAKMKEREAKKKDEVAIQLIDIETALDAGQIPAAGSREFLKKIAEETSPHREVAEQLLRKLQEREDENARKILNQARRLFDVEKDYPEAMNLLESIRRDYPETEEMPSVQILLEETERRLKRSKNYVPSLQEAR